MTWLARWIVRPGAAWSVVVVALLVSALGAVFASRVEQDDDLLAFLPEGNADVAAFRQINERFGGLDVALVGVRADPLDPDVFARLKATTQALDDHPAVERALSLANVDDFTPEEGGGIRTDFLVREVPADARAQKELRKKVFARDLVIGQLVSEDGGAFTILCFAAHGQDPRAFAGTVQQIVRAQFESEAVYWGGAPFVSTYIFSTTQSDLRRLTPWAVLAVVLLVFLAFRDVVGAGVALLSTGMGIAVSMGLMGLLGVKYNIVLSSMPVILFSVGSAYGIHVLARFYPLAGELGPVEALQQTLRSTGPTVITAGLTTVVGLLSFLAMDIEPMRTFGLFTAIGIFATLVFALTFVPAVVVVLRLGHRRVAEGRISDALIPMVSLAQTRRLLVGAVLLLVAGTGGWYASRVDTRMDQTAFFAPESEPAQADRFFLTHFGGSQYIQVHFEGDFEDPHVLRELTRFADEVRDNPKVAGVQHIAQVLSLTNAAMEGSRRVPDDAEKTRLLYTFLAGRASVDQLVTRDHREAVLHIKIGTSDIEDVEALLTDVEALAERTLVTGYRVVAGDTVEGRARLRGYVMARIRAMLAQAGLRIDATAVQRAQAALEADNPPERVAVRDGLRTFLTSEECIVDLSGSSQLVDGIADAVVAQGPQVSAEGLMAALGVALRGVDEIDGEPVSVVQEDLQLSIETPLAELWRRARADARARAALEAADRAQEVSPVLFARISDALEALEAPTALVADPGGAGGTLAARVNGLPVLHRGLSRSATKNQINSLAIALALVVLLLGFALRSARLGLIAASPTVLTLLVIYGGMGWLGVHLDIGTSMLASIIIGAGVDYAVHLVVAWREHEGPEAASRAVRQTGPAIWTNALMVAAGFFLLTLGDARTLQNVGGLTAAAMLTAAIATFLAVPVLMARARVPAEAPAEAAISEVPEDNLQEG